MGTDKCYVLLCICILFSQFAVLNAQDETVLLQYLATWGEAGNKPLQFKEPQGISVDPSGYLYIADTGNERIQKLNSEGQFITEIGGYGWEREQFDTPLDVCAKNGLDVFVADFQNHRIERYDKDLHYLASFSTSEEWPENLQFGFPKAVDLSPQGELFCLDGENQRILKLDVLGEPQISFGDFDAGAGQLALPQRMMISQDGKVFVSDAGKNCIVVFDIHSNYLYSVGNDMLEMPMGMTATPDGFLLVADSHKKQIWIFHTSGQWITACGPQIGKLCTLHEPVDVAVWKDRLYVLDKKQHAIVLFQLVYQQ